MKSSKTLSRCKLLLASILALWLFSSRLNAQGNPQSKTISRAEIVKAIKKASQAFQSVAVEGGYVYYYSLDTGQRWGEGKATASQVWVQPPGTPTVGEAFLDAYHATGDSSLLDAAKKTGDALLYGQLKSGGWTNLVDFDPRSKSAGLYRNGRGKGKNNSSLDDDQTGAALRFLIRLDDALEHKDQAVSQGVKIGLKALLDAQFPNGAFPQVWKGTVAKNPLKAASYPDYDWKTENRIKNYWDLYTLNDNVTGSVARVLILAHQTYGDDLFLECLTRLGDFLVAAQMPEPQPAWAQQYDYQMRPVWARRFEPPAICSDETQETIQTLMLISSYCQSKKYLKPIPAALRWLEKSGLNDLQFARYYELKTNRPLYMNRKGKNYFLTYSDANLPDHYGWKIRSRVDSLKSDFQKADNGNLEFDELIRRVRGHKKPSVNQIRQIIDSLDSTGRWVDVYRSQALVGQPKFQEGERFLNSRTFANRIHMLSDALSSK